MGRWQVPFARALFALLALALPGASSHAQHSIEVQATRPDATGPRLQVQSPVLTVDSERMFAETRIGRQIRSEVERASVALQARNDEIASELEAEELSLTERRPDMAPEDFRALAEAFDQKTQRVRAERAAELRELGLQNEEQRRQFMLKVAQPVLQQLMFEAGAVIVMEQGDVFISSLAIDITDTAIARIDAATQLVPDAPD